MFAPMNVLDALLPPSTVKAAAASSAVAIAQDAASGRLLVGPVLYSGLATCLALAGIYLARKITIRDENKRLGRKQSTADTLPETWIAMLLVCPAIWHFGVSVPMAPLIGIGVGYTIKLLLRIIGRGTVAAAKAAIRQGAADLHAAPADEPNDPRMDDLIDRLNDQ